MQPSGAGDEIMTTIRHFSGDIQGYHPVPMPNGEAAKLFPGVRLVRSDGFKVLVGFANSGPDTYDSERCRWNRDLFIGALPITRRIARPDHASNHKCDARCRGAKGHQCECSCGGRNHGIDA
jgi:hypothetical protein